MADAFELDDLAATDTGELTIVSPVTGEPTTWVWTLAGPGHPITVAQADKASREALKLEQQRAHAAAAGKKFREPEITLEERKERNARFFADRVLGWTPVTIRGEPYPWSVDNAVKLLLNPAYGRIYGQLAEYFLSETAFTKPSASN